MPRSTESRFYHQSSAICRTYSSTTNHPSVRSTSRKLLSDLTLPSTYAENKVIQHTMARTRDDVPNSPGLESSVEEVEQLGEAEETQEVKEAEKAENDDNDEDEDDSFLEDEKEDWTPAGTST